MKQVSGSGLQRVATLKHLWFCQRKVCVSEDKPEPAGSASDSFSEPSVQSRFSNKMETYLCFLNVSADSAFGALFF